MANNIRVWTKEELEQLGAEDCVSRPIKQNELINFRCSNCGKIGQSKLVYVLDTLKRHSLRWRCRDCIRQENRENAKKSGGGNFKAHTEKTKASMKESQRKRWNSVPESERQEIGKQIRQAATEKFGGNPMHNAVVRAKYKKAVGEFWSNPEAVAESAEKRRSTCLAKYGTPNYLSSLAYQESEAAINLAMGKSKPEEELRKYIESLGFNTRKALKTNSHQEELDIVVDSAKLAIEVGNIWHHSEVFRSQNYHLKKLFFAKKMGLKLVQFFWPEYKVRREQIDARLRSLLGVYTNKIMARKCKLDKVSKEDARTFLEKYHIQGAGRFSEAFGLFSEGELVAISSFSPHHRGLNETVMSRFCVKSDTAVIGGLSKLTKYGVKRFGKISTWCDLRWSDGSGYRASGWVEVATLPPDYFYVSRCRNKIISKQSRRKTAVNTPEGMTEREHAIADGLVRVWDCGKIKFVAENS